MAEKITSPHAILPRSPAQLRLCENLQHSQIEGHRICYVGPGTGLVPPPASRPVFTLTCTDFRTLIFVPPGRECQVPRRCQFPGN
jgi:hypothetical protein